MKPSEAVKQNKEIQKNSNDISELNSRRFYSNFQKEEKE